MDGLTQKSFTNGSNIKYIYYAGRAAESKPTVLLLHGCPDVASMWGDLINAHLRPAGYGVVAPDLIGYGGSDKPKELEHYATNKICEDVAGILDQEGVCTVIAVGHDFGAVLASRMCNFQSARIAGLITFGTAYVPPSPYPFDFEQLRAMQEKQQGYCSTWYFPFFTSASGASIIDAHLANMFTVLHGGGARMRAILCVEGGIEKWLEGGKNADGETADTATVLPYAQAAGFRDEWMDRLHRDGWTAPLNWYKAFTANLATDAEKAAFAGGHHVVKAPYLFVAAQNDPLSSPEAVRVPIEYGMLPNITQKSLDASHWCMLERPHEAGKAVTSWLEEKFPQ